MEQRWLLASPVQEFPLPTTNDWPSYMTAGPDGNVWITEAPHVFVGVDYIYPPPEWGPIAKVAPDGTITEFRLQAHVIPGPITAGPDGTMWFAEIFQDGRGHFTPLGIGRINTDGVVSAVPNTAQLEAISAMTRGPDGSVWALVGNTIDRISAAGTSVTSFSAPNADAHGFVVGPDSAVWFTESFVGPAGLQSAIGRLDSATGTVANFLLPFPGVEAESLAIGSDGNAWFTEGVFAYAGVSRIGRVTPQGAFTQFDLGITNSFASGILAGPDGALYFLENSPGTPPNYKNPVNAIGRITTNGAISYTPDDFGTAGARTTIGPDGNLWFSEFDINRIGKLALAPQAMSVNVASATAHGPLNEVVVSFSGPLTSLQAENLSNYSLAALGRPGPRGHRREFAVPLRSVSYDNATRTITIRVRGVIRSGGDYQLTLDTAPPRGLIGANGIALAGSQNGRLVTPFSGP
jgi:streptogramin lyase